jgi:hypothetical protein
MLNGVMSTLCARTHSGSSVSAVNSPFPAGPRCSTLRPPPIFLSNRVSSQISSTISGPDTSSRIVPIALILKIGPYSSAIRTKPPSGSAVSTSKTLPSTGTPRGPGMGSVIRRACDDGARPPMTGPSSRPAS